MIDVFHEIKDTPIPTLLVLGGIVFLVLAVASRIAGRIEVDPQRQRLSAIIGVALLLVGIALYLAPTSLLANQPELAVAPPVSSVPATSSTSLLPSAPPLPSAPLAATAVESEPSPPTTPLPPTAQPIPTTSPASQRRSPEESLRDYWQAVSEQHYADAWPMLSANFRWTTHGNDFDAYVHGYQEQGLCDVAPDDLAIVTQTDDYALITATMIYHKGADCTASPLGLIFHMAPAEDHTFWRIDRVELR